MDDVLAVMDAAGSRARRDLRHARGRPDGRAVRRHPPGADRARSSSTRPSRAPPGRPTTTGPGTPRSARRTWTSSSAHWGEGLVAGSRGAEPAWTTPRSWSGPGGSSGWPRARARSRRIFDLIGEFDVRDVLPSIRVPTLVMHRARRQLHQRRALALHRRAHPGRPARRARGRRQHVLDRRHRGAARRDRGVPHRRAPRARARPHARHGAVHRHRAAPPSAPPSSATARWRYLLERHDALFRRALDRHRGREVKRTGDGFLATFDGPARAIRCAADDRPSRWRRSGSRSAPACTPASWR